MKRPNDISELTILPQHLGVGVKLGTGNRPVSLSSTIETPALLTLAYHGHTSPLPCRITKKKCTLNTQDNCILLNYTSTNLIVLNKCWHVTNDQGHTNRDLNRIRYFSLGIQVNTKYINFTEGTSSKVSCYLCDDVCRLLISTIVW